MSFDTALAFVLAREGGLVDNPNDPGGLTNLGISQRQYPNVDIRHLTVAQAGALYRRDYWLPAGCDRLPDAPALVVFDSAVNCGVPRALEWLRTTPTPEDYLWTRLDYYRRVVLGRPPSLAFLPGWVRRLVLLRGALGSP